MYVCVCKAVCDREVEAAIDDGATSVEAVTNACGAGGDCGACHKEIADRLARRTQAAHAHCDKRRLGVIAA
jgi:bacterioferritin-associated ferredoxin